MSISCTGISDWVHRCHLHTTSSNMLPDWTTEVGNMYAHEVSSTKFGMSWRMGKEPLL